MKNPKRYREMCEPHATLDVANESMLAFFDAVEAARTAHRIADVHVLAVVRYETDEGEAEGMGRVHYGDNLRALPMLAEAYGKERVEFDKVLGRAKAGGTA